MRRAEPKRFAVVDVLITLVVVGSISRVGVERFARGCELRLFPHGELAFWTDFAMFEGSTLFWAILFVQLRRYAGSRRRLSRMPGFAACLSVVVYTLVQGLFDAIIYQKGPLSERAFVLVWNGLVRPGSIQSAPMIAAGWGVLALNGRCKPAGDRADGIASGLGAIWIVLGLSYSFLVAVE